MTRTGTRRALVQLVTVFGAFLGSGLLGLSISELVAPGSALASVTTGLLFPVVFFAGYLAWVGVAILHLPAALWRWLRGETRRSGPDEPFIPPGSMAFLWVSLLLSLPAGLASGLVPDGWAPLPCTALHALLGGLFGTLLWRLAKAGWLPFPEE